MRKLKIASFINYKYITIDDNYYRKFKIIRFKCLSMKLKILNHTNDFNSKFSSFLNYIFLNSFDSIRYQKSY